SSGGLLLLAAGFGFGLAVIVSCSLDLDESLIDKTRDANFIDLDGTLPDGAPIDGSTDGLSSNGGFVQACTTDADCKTSDGCLKGKCDLPRKTCAYEVCRSACGAGVCDQQNHTCGPAVPYKLKATQFPLGQALACIRCAAAVYPWLVVGTVTGAVAFNV